MALNDIPLLICGTLVGLAHINDDGTIDLEVTAPCQIGIDWMTEFAAGLHDSMAIGPFMNDQGSRRTPTQPL